MRKPARGRVHSPGLLRSFVEYLRGREQTLVRAPEPWPLLLLSYPTGSNAIAGEVRDAWLHTLPSLHAPVVAPYLDMMCRLPTIVVVQLRPHNICTCLGHHHPAGTESRLTRSLAGDLGDGLGEIDLAWEAIRGWRPHPLRTTAAESIAGFEHSHFRTALLTVLLHELEHLAYPDHQERSVRGASDEFYTQVLEELLSLA
ncbi:MAG: hypothetical protein LC126_00350 [Bryobacterales bacterium]|nr:hypothetical protein [Bryobacterales bacterium]